MVQQAEKSGPSDTAFAIGILAAAGVVVAMWLGAVLSAVLAGHRPPRPSLIAVLRLTHDWRHPSAAWIQPVGPVQLYWTMTVLVLAAAVGALAWVWLHFHRHGDGMRSKARVAAGLAGRSDVRRAAGERALIARAAALRPSVDSPKPCDLGHFLGRSHGLACWASAEDSIVVLGPPRCGKGLHLVIPMILDAPGAVIATSTRPDNLTATLTARRSNGPVAVFDPQRLAPGVAEQVCWSPARGCENPQAAMIRARALTSGVADGTAESNFWQRSATQAVQCLLHAAALSGATTEDLYRWSLSPVAASEALGLLADHPKATATWMLQLESILARDPKQRDSIWAMVTLAFSALADPNVLKAVSPPAGGGFDPAEFLQRKGTLYLLGTSSGAGSTTGLVAAFIEDVVEVARRMAAASEGVRLDPPLTLMLDEAANYPVPSLPSLMSEGGGSGISTVVVLQSLAQARAAWGENEGAALWDAAIVKLILGGGSNTRDLEDLSRLIGSRREVQTTESIGPDGRRTRSMSKHDVPVLEPGKLRELAPSTAVLLLRVARPIMLQLEPWIDRPDAELLKAQQRRLVDLIRNHRDDDQAME